MRYLTPEAAAVVGLFDRCYERRSNGFDAPTWHLVALPASGAMADQDAWTVEALAFLRDVRNRMEQDRYLEASGKPRGAVKLIDVSEPELVTHGE